MDAAAVRDPAILAFQDKVHASGRDDIRPDLAEVLVVLKDGTQHSARVDHCAGSASRPMSDADLETKFLGQAEAVIGPARSRTLMDTCWSIANVTDVAELARLSS